MGFGSAAPAHAQTGSAVRTVTALKTMRMFGSGRTKGGSLRTRAKSPSGATRRPSYRGLSQTAANQLQLLGHDSWVRELDESHELLYTFLEARTPGGRSA